MNLKTCPFCGSRAYLYKCEADIEEPYTVMCEGCEVVTANYETEDEAIEAWNRREEPEIIRCKDCKWWDQFEENHPYGYCRACRSGTHTERWEISIRRQSRFDFFCADAEPQEEEEE